MIKRFDDRKAIEHYLPPGDEGDTAVRKERAVALWQRLQQIVANHPKQSLIAALTAGALLGWITKRR